MNNSTTASQGLSCVTWETGPFLFGFGKKDLSMETLAAGFPDLSWAHLKQVHSARVVESANPEAAAPLAEADAHFTTQPNLALVIKTADCLPVLIGAFSGEAEKPEGKPHAVCAIHAGWRGVGTDIIQNSVRALLERGYAPTKMTVAIGPHIQLKSFEVGIDVARELKEAAKRAKVPDPQSVIHPHATDPSKRRVDLVTIARHQLTSLAVPIAQIHTLDVDTLTTPEWASFRRDGKSAGRNLSFVGTRFFLQKPRG